MFKYRGPKYHPGGLPIATYVVTKVRKHWSADRSHRHIEGVCLDNGTYYTRHEVVASIREGDTWLTSADGLVATITPLSYCPHITCLDSPYIKTNPDSSKKDNLENLEEC